MEEKFEDAFNAASQKAEQQAEATMEAELEREAAEEQAFSARAKRCPASVMSAKQIGSLNARPLLALHLKVEAPDGAYEVDVEHAPDAQDAHRYATGSRIEVDVDSSDRQRVKCA
jgi:hypothetical protein